MAFGSNKDNPNPTPSRGLGKILDRSGTAASLNQIRGVNISGSTGSGIPKHVTNVAASVSAANQGATSVVTVTFRRDPGDSSYNTSQIYVKGYNSNPQNVLIASGANSPISFVLNNTGECRGRAH
jgi:hypothetical protein